MVPVFPVIQPFFQIFRPGNHHRSPAPSRDGQHLRMVRRAHDHRLAAPVFRLRHNLVDVGDIGAGGVEDLHPPAGEILMDRPALAVGPDDHPAAAGDLLRPVHRPQALGGQPAHHLLVVDDGPQHHAGRALGGLLLGQLHRPPHAVAEAGGLCQHHLHSTPSPRRRTRSIRSWAMAWRASLEGLRPSNSG